MKPCLSYLTVLIVALFPACPSAADDDLKRFDRFPTYKFDTRECTDEDKGFYQYSCKNIETGDVSGYINPSKLEEDKDGIFLGKYWGTGNRLKFIGTACGRGDTEEEAKRNASFHAHAIVERFVDEFESYVLIGKFKPLGYRKDEERYVCVLTRTGDPKNEAQSDVDDGDDQSDTYEQLVKKYQQEAEQRQLAERQRQEREEAERRKTMLVVEVRSLDKYAVELSFYSKSYGNRAWPGDGRVYILSDSEFHTHRLNCRPKEKICYGAWRRGNTRSYWGAGYGAREGCGNCCMYCGGTYKYTLNAGSDSPSVSNQDAVNALGAILGGVAAGIGAANSRPSAAPSYRPSAPVPRGANRGPSSISGRSN
jgi:hypothetical protein